MEAYTGEIRLFAGNYATNNWLICDGTLLNINEYQVLYTLIGTTYGGDGVNTFALPNLNGRVAVNQGQAPNMSNYVMGSVGGTEVVQLGTANLPAHNHAVNVSTANANVDSPSGNFLAAPIDSKNANNQFVSYLPQTAAGLIKAPLDINSITPTTGGQVHNNLMPYLTMTYMICTIGIYPQFN